MNTDPAVIDDSDLVAMTQRWLQGREADIAQSKGVDMGAARALLQRHRNQLKQRVLEELAQAAPVDGFAYELLPLPSADPIVLLRLRALGVARLLPTGQPEFAQEFLFVVAIRGDGRPQDAEVRCLTQLTPLWHPQVSSEGQVNLAGWPVENWSAFVQTLRSLVTYAYYHTDHDILNPDAALWAMHNTSLFPLDAWPSQAAW